MICSTSGNFTKAAAALTIGTLICGLSKAGAQEAMAMPLDTPTEIAGIETVCTGIGLESRQDPRWAAYSLKVEVAGKGGQYLGDVHVAVSKDGRKVVDAMCGGPWVLFKIPAGKYQVTATVEGQTASSPAYALTGNQGRIILRFPETGGEMDNVPSGNS